MIRDRYIHSNTYLKKKDEISKKNCDCVKIIIIISVLLFVCSGKKIHLISFFGYGSYG